MVKKKLLSLSLVAVMTISSIAPAFAEEIEENIFVDNGAEIVIETGDSQIIPMGNERYRYVTKTVLGKKTTKKLVVTKSMATSEKVYSNTLKKFALGTFNTVLPSNIIGQVASSLIDSALDNIYHSPFEKTGTYTITIQAISKVKVNVITKKGYVEKRGYIHTIKFKGKTYSRTYWLKK